MYSVSLSLELTLFLVKNEAKLLLVCAIYVLNFVHIIQDVYCSAHFNLEPGLMLK